jgi:hypothetical protein
MSDQPVLAVAKLVADSITAQSLAKMEELLAQLRGSNGAAQQRWIQALELSGRQMCWQLAQRRHIDSLADAEFKVFSQWGEDGIIEWLIQQLPIAHETFIEFGVGSYFESNTRFLLTNRNWRGLILDSGEVLRQIPGEPYYWRHDLTCGVAFITPDNIDALFAKHGFGGEIGLLSIDIDGNDAWVLERIAGVSPAILICEYNAMFGDLQPLSVPYDPAFSIEKAHPSMLYFGASIGAMRRIAEAKGYRFVGTCSNGVNAFFVRNDLAPHLDGRLSRVVAHPSLHRCCYDPNGGFATLSGLARFDQIKDLPAVHLETGKIAPLASFGELFSADWRRRIGHRPA